MTERLALAVSRLNTLVQAAYDSDFRKRVTITPTLGADISLVCDNLLASPKILAVLEAAREVDCGDHDFLAGRDSADFYLKDFQPCGECAGCRVFAAIAALVRTPSPAASSEFDQWYATYTASLPPGGVRDHMYAAWWAGFMERERTRA